MRAFWKFLASLKLAIALLILLAAASAVGTLVPQGRSLEEYSRRYGTSYSIIHALQFDRVYRSGWFIGLLILFSVNTAACTASRFPAKWRRAAGPAAPFDPASLKALKVRDSFHRKMDIGSAAGSAESALRGRGYSVGRAVNGEGTFILARKRRLGWFGSDLVHVGILVILCGGIVSGLGSKRQPIELFEGMTAAIPGADFSIRLDKFRTEYYENGAVKDWKSDLTVLESGVPVRTASIEVNHPLRHRGVVLYQSAYGMSWNNAELGFELRKASDPAFIMNVSAKPGRKVEAAGPGVTAFAVRNFIPDFIMGKGGRAQSRSNEANNPAAQVEVWNGAETVFAGWVFAKYPDFKGMMQKKGETAPDIRVVMKPPVPAVYSVVEARRDPGAPFIWAGCLLLTAGLGLAFYWRPREIRLALRPSAGGTDVAAGGTASGMGGSFEAEFKGIMKAIGSGQ